MKKLNFSQLINKINKYQLIVLGEIHGTKEIPLVIEKILKHLIKELDFIFLEIPKHQQRYIDAYIISKNHFDIPFFTKQKNDGRASREIFFVLKFIKDYMFIDMKQIEIICVDPDVIKNRDFLMYKEIKKYLRNKNHKKGIFIAGNVHASKEKLKINNKFVIPCGCYLKKDFGKELTSINITANKGAYYNYGIKSVIAKKRKTGIYKSSISNYDFEYILNKVTPCTFLTN